MTFSPADKTKGQKGNFSLSCLHSSQSCPRTDCTQHQKRARETRTSIFQSSWCLSEASTEPAVSFTPPHQSRKKKAEPLADHKGLQNALTAQQQQVFLSTIQPKQMCCVEVCFQLCSWRHNGDCPGCLHCTDACAEMQCSYQRAQTKTDRTLHMCSKRKNYLPYA